MAFTLDPDARLDFKFPWATQGWLETGETIVSFTVTADDEDLLTVESAAVDDAGDVVVWLTGGTDGADVAVTCHIVTSAGRADDRTLTVRIRER